MNRIGFTILFIISGSFMVSAAGKTPELARSTISYDGDFGKLLVDEAPSEIASNFINRSNKVPDAFKLVNTSVDPAKVHFQQVASGFTQPLFLTHADDGSGRLFVTERSGRIYILKKGSVLPTPFLNIQSIVNSASSEQGLLALAFHPNYENNGKFYTVHTIQDGSLILSQFTRSANPPVFPEKFARRREQGN